MDIKVLTVTKHADGSATLILDIDEQVYDDILTYVGEDYEDY